MFTPVKKSTLKEEIKKHLLAGDIIRCDSRDETPLEVMPRERVPYLPSMGNIGHERTVIKNIQCSHDLLHETVCELEEEYSVSKVFCACSGCCQYAVHAYYIDGD